MTASLLWLCLALVVAASEASPCPNLAKVIVRQKIDGGCYFVDATLKNRSADSARDECRNYGRNSFQWNLPKIDTVQKYDESIRVLGSIADSSIFVGLRRDALETSEGAGRGRNSKWRWTTDNATLESSFRNGTPPWAPNQPDDYFFESTERCVSMTGKKWFAVRCDKEIESGLLCETMPPCENPPCDSATTTTTLTLTTIATKTISSKPPDVKIGSTSKTDQVSNSHWWLLGGCSFVALICVGIIVGLLYQRRRLRRKRKTLQIGLASPGTAVVVAASSSSSSGSGESKSKSKKDKRRKKSKPESVESDPTNSSDSDDVAFAMVQPLPKKKTIAKKMKKKPMTKVKKRSTRFS